jgi:hypothetical protein
MATKKRRSPRDKKARSLAKDRRNAYGAHSKGSRKAIPKRKAERAGAERRLAHQSVSVAGVQEDSVVLDQLPARLRKKRLTGWKKFPDRSLAKAIEVKREKRQLRVGRKKRSREAFRRAVAAQRAAASNETGRK